ncbi:hypothetical protein [Pantoea sp. B65]|uniref:hypothetical protein n=1 Tax=Pantoea sp. B65 TaxID=2813359 RepID=UPI0039B65FA3
MINRYTLTAMAAVFALTGCAKHSVDEPATNFASGATLVTVKNVPARTADGATVFVTVDGNEAGALPTGESVELHMPAGKHKIGGYARSLIGRVTIPSVEVTTTSDSIKHVAYTVKKSKPTFEELSSEPIPQKPAPVEAQAQTQTPVAATAQTSTAAATQTSETTSTAAATTQAAPASTATATTQTTEQTATATTAQSTEQTSATTTTAAQTTEQTPTTTTTTEQTPQG